MSNNWQQPSYLSLSTQKRDGSRVDTPVWFARDDDGFIYCFSEGDAGKIKRMRNFSTVRVNPCSVSGALQGRWQQGQSTLLSDPSEVNRAYCALLKKYGWQLRLLNIISRVSGKIHKRAFVRIELGELL